MLDRGGIIATREPLRAGSTSQSVRAMSVATDVPSSTASRRYSVSFVRHPPRSANAPPVPASTTTAYQHSTGSHLTVVDRGCVNVNSMPLRPTRQSNATATRAAAASSLTYVDSGTSAAYNTTSASVASYCTSLQPSATSSLVPYSQSYGRSQMPTIHVPFATSTSPQFPPGQANTSTLSPEIANLGIGLAAEPKKCYGWMKMSTTTGEQITLFDEVSSYLIKFSKVQPEISKKINHRSARKG